MARRRSRIPLVAIAPFFLACLAPALAFDADFGFYPKNARPCLNKAAASSKCTGATAQLLNKCFCSNGGDFATSAAKCLGETDKGEVQKVYAAMSGACSDSDTPLSVSQSDFLAAANGDAKPSTTSASSSASSTPTSTSDPTSSPTSTGDADPDKKKSSLSTGATIGIAVAVSIAGVALVAALAFWLVRRKKRNGAGNAHQLLPQDYKYRAATTFPPQEPSPGLGHFGNETKGPSWDQVHNSNPYNRDSYLTQTTGGSPDPRHQSFMTGSQYAPPSEQGTQYVGPYAAPDGVAELPPDAEVQAGSNSHVFEMDGSQVSSQDQGQGRRYEPFRPRQ